MARRTESERLEAANEGVGRSGLSRRRSRAWAIRGVGKVGGIHCGRSSSRGLGLGLGFDEAEGEVAVLQGERHRAGEGPLGHAVETGARNIDFILQGSLLPRITAELLSGLASGATLSRMVVGLDAEGGLTVTASA